MQINDSSAVSSSMETLRPSTPMKYSMLNAGIHSARSTNCMEVVAVSKLAYSQTPRISGGTVAAAETQRMRSWRPLGRINTTSIPARGKKTM